MKIDRSSASSATVAPAGADPRLFVDSLDKAMRVLAVFRYDKPTSIADVAKLTGIGRSAAQRYVHSWHVLNYIRLAPSGKGYVLAPGGLGLTTQFLQSNFVLDRAQPYLMEVNRRTQETVFWGELDDLEFVLLLQIPGQGSTFFHANIGTRYPAIHSTSGLAILAFLPRAHADAIIERSVAMMLPSRTVMDRPAIQAILDNVRSTGFCITEQILFDGRISVSAPVFDARNQAIAAVNISTLLLRHSRQSVENELAPLVVEAAQAISTALGRNTK